MAFEKVLVVRKVCVEAAGLAILGGEETFDGRNE